MTHEEIDQLVTEADIERGYVEITVQNILGRDLTYRLSVPDWRAQQQALAEFYKKGGEHYWDIGWLCHCALGGPDLAKGLTAKLAKGLTVKAHTQIQNVAWVLYFGTESLKKSLEIANDETLAQALGLDPAKSIGPQSSSTPSGNSGSNEKSSSPAPGTPKRQNGGGKNSKSGRKP